MADRSRQANAKKLSILSSDAHSKHSDLEFYQFKANGSLMWVTVTQSVLLRRSVIMSLGKILSSAEDTE